jgi:HEAT repeat protein
MDPLRTILGGSGARALLVAVLSLILVLVYSRAERAMPRSEEAPEASPPSHELTSVAAVPPLSLVSSVRSALARAAAAAAAPAPAQAQDAAIVQALTGLLRDTLPAVREAAARALGERGAAARSAVPALVVVLTDPQRRVRQQAAEALGDIGDPQAVEPLADVLALDPVRDVAEEAARALGRIATPEAAARLETALLGASLRDDLFRRVVVQALGRTGQSAAVERLEALFPLADRRLQQTIVESFADAGTPSSTNALLRMMQSPDPNLRLLAARALGGR